MPYAQGRTYFDADSHLMETSDWLVGYADPALRDKIRPLHLGGAGAMAEQAVVADGADLVAFGKPYIANPDLVERLRVNAPWNEPDRMTFYGGGAKGYTDYPALKA